MGFCGKCGNSIEENAKFCGVCGNPVISNNGNMNNLTSNNNGFVDVYNPSSSNSGFVDVNNFISNNNESTNTGNYTSNNNGFVDVYNPSSNNSGFVNANNSISNNKPSNVNRLNNSYVVSNKNNVHNKKRIKHKRKRNASHNLNAGTVIGGCCIGVALLIVVITLTSFVSKNKYYFGEEKHQGSYQELYNYVNQPNNDSINFNSINSSKSSSKTSIIYDNTYTGISLNSLSDAYGVIDRDSVEQKSKCPSEILGIENHIISEYGITAVNLCEMDVLLAKEIEKVIGTVYYNFPSARGFITNISLANVSPSEDYIAAFLPFFPFITSETYSTLPWGLKTEIVLNSSYFLNINKLQVTVNQSSRSGHFPPNATIYSPVAHEFGHLLSFLSMLRYYKLDSVLIIDDNVYDKFYNVVEDFNNGNYSYSLIDNAYKKYIKDTSKSIDLDSWRGSISKYALAKDNSGNYIWDETIAEAFHDVYLNGNNAVDASKYIYNELKGILK